MWPTVLTAVANLVLAVISIVATAFATKWVVAEWTNVKEPHVAAFALVLGYFMARSGTGTSVRLGPEGMSEDEAMALGKALGGVVGLWLVWWLLFRRFAPTSD